MSGVFILAVAFASFSALGAFFLMLDASAERDLRRELTNQKMLERAWRRAKEKGER
jgi:hypothetical protein